MATGQGIGFDIQQVIQMAAELAARKALEPLQEQMNTMQQDIAVVKNRLLDNDTGLVTMFEAERVRVDAALEEIHKRISRTSASDRSVKDSLKASWKTICVVAVVLWEVVKEWRHK